MDLLLGRRICLCSMEIGETFAPGDVSSSRLLAQSPLPAEPQLLFSRFVCSLAVLWMGWMVFCMEEGFCSFLDSTPAQLCAVALLSSRLFHGVSEGEAKQPHQGRPSPDLQRVPPLRAAVDHHPLRSDRAIARDCCQP